jgi:uncharacterized damage-inducible protein DinB
MSVATLKSLFEYKRWANRELFDMIERLPADEKRLPMVRTLSHIYTADRIFRAHLAGELHSFASTHMPELPTLADLRRDVEDTDEWFLLYVSNLTPEALEQRIHFRFTDGDLGTLSREEILLHITTHGCYHRGNVGQMLRDRGLPPPFDIYTRFLHQKEPDRRS